MKKRLLSAALALAMVLTLLPVSAFAATPADANTPESGKTNVQYVSGTDYSKQKIDKSYVSDEWAWQYKDSTDNKTYWAGS